MNVREELLERLRWTLDEAAFKAAAGIKGASLAIRGGKATLKLADGERTWDLYEGNFPDIESVIAKYDAVDVPFGVNPELLATLGKALGGGGRQYNPILLHAPPSPLLAMRVEMPRDSSHGVVMPVRTERTVDPKPRADLTDPDVVLAGVTAAARALARRKGKLKAVDAFHAATLRATLAGAEAA